MIICNYLSGHHEIPEASFVTDVWAYSDPITDKEYALITDNFLGLFIVDVNDPTNPVLASQINSVAGFDVKSWQNYIYTVTGSSNGSGSIIDIFDPSKPVVVGTFLLLETYLLAIKDICMPKHPV
ncbi:MAG: hypothetical protein AMJ61_00350 [Desulfobacterales bacterium SG8_35_2]|nr:MAG: hypothetical protein AMJ61_00350 [Desulfobacterales bacterium SG8_35_2]